MFRIMSIGLHQSNTFFSLFPFISVISINLMKANEWKKLCKFDIPKIVWIFDRLKKATAKWSVVMWFWIFFYWWINKIVCIWCFFFPDFHSKSSIIKREITRFILFLLLFVSCKWVFSLKKIKSLMNKLHMHFWQIHRNSLRQKTNGPSVESQN